jgi:hypothetical protein
VFERVEGLAVLEHAAAQFGDQEIVSRETHGPLHRSTFAEVGQPLWVKTKRLAPIASN